MKRKRTPRVSWATCSGQVLSLGRLRGDGALRLLECGDGTRTRRVLLDKADMRRLAARAAYLRDQMEGEK